MIFACDLNSWLDEIFGYLGCSNEDVSKFSELLIASVDVDLRLGPSSRVP